MMRKAFSLMLLIAILIVTIQLVQGLARVNDRLAEQAARESAGRAAVAP